MSDSRPSFTPARKWAVGLNVALTVVVVFGLVLMVNYLSGRHFKRLHLSSLTAIQLSPRTISLVQSITNDVQVTLYFDKDDEEGMYSDVNHLLKEYQALNPRLNVRTVDYYREPGAAVAVMTKYDLGASTNENFVIFECGGRTKIVNAKGLLQTELEAIGEREWRRKPVAFHGELRFTEALLAVTSERALKAYFLEGHGEPSIHDPNSLGLTTFTNILKQNHIESASLTLLGTNAVPEDCSLLIVPGSTDPIPPAELEKIENYLSRNGRLFALFNAKTAVRPTGLEKVLATWGAFVGADIVVDLDQLDMNSKQNIAVSGFALHPAVNPVLGSGIYMSLPRPVSALPSTNSLQQKLKIDVIAATGTNAFVLSSEGKQRRQLPVLVAVERADPVAALNEEGVPARMLVCGDSFFLCNQLIDMLGNRTFADCAVNWLLDRSVLLDIGPRPVNEYRLVIAPGRMKSLQWILLGGIPAGILLFGGIIWLTRRR